MWQVKRKKRQQAQCWAQAAAAEAAAMPHSSAACRLAAA
jgi:hypothetical protein